MKKKKYMIARVAASRVLAVTVLAATGLVTAAAQTPSLPKAETIIERVQANLRLPGFEAVNRLTITDARGRERVRELAMLSAYDTAERLERRIIRFLSPADVRGTGLLVFDYETADDDMWLYLPAVRRARRIASNEKNGSFLGSEFTYADMTMLGTHEFEYTVIERSTVRGEPCYILEQLPRSREVARDYGFARRQLAVHADRFVLWEAVYFDERGRETRRLTVDRIVDVGNGNFRAATLRMDNLLNGRSSTLELGEFARTENVDPQYFTVPYLERF